MRQDAQCHDADSNPDFIRYVQTVSDYSSYMWSVPDWRTDETYSMLDNREQGIYRNLIDECWVSGSITSDPEILARFVREPLDYFALVWAKIRPKFASIDKGLRLISPRLEQDRRRLMLTANFDHKRAVKAAQIRWSKHRAERTNKPSTGNDLDATSINRAYAQASFEHSPEHAFEQCQIQTHTKGSITLPLKDSPKLIHNSPFEVSPPPNGRARDLAADWFADRCLELTGSPYVSEAGDFVQLARLRKGFKLPSREKPPGWDDAVTNYFASPLSQYSLADLANPKRYAVFKNSPLNEFKVPVNHQKAQGETHEQRKERVRQENLQSVLSRIAESGEPSLKPGTERGANGDLHRIAGKSQ